MLHLEELLNDLAVIRVTFETVEVFPDDPELAAELTGVIAGARSQLIHRLEEVRDSVGNRRTVASDNSLRAFKEMMLRIIDNGTPRQRLNSLMKVDVDGPGADPLYRYEFNPSSAPDGLRSLLPVEFAAGLFGDVLATAADVACYQSKRVFDEQVYQKFMAVMFAVYASTDPMFYGSGE